MSKPQPIDKDKAGETGSSAVEVFLHALVVIEISDHFTRGNFIYWLFLKLDIRFELCYSLFSGELYILNKEIECLFGLERVRNPKVAHHRVFGALLGVQSGRIIHLHRSYELVCTEVDGAFVIDIEYLKRKRDQCTHSFIHSLTLSYKRLYPHIHTITHSFSHLHFAFLLSLDCFNDVIKNKHSHN
jgi:hypothetical protein